MSYPAFSSFFADPERTNAKLCVYMALQPPFLSHAVPKDVKLEVVRHNAHLNRGAVIDALRWLERRGYIVVHARDARGVPSMTLAWALPNNGFSTAPDSAPIRAGAVNVAAHTPE